MRRAAIATILLGAVAVATPGSAGAHTCGSPVAVEVGERAVVPVGLPAEQAAVTGVEITVPKGFRLARVRPPAGWRATAEETTVHLQGGTIEPFGCATATLEGTATAEGELVFRITTTATDGTSAEATQSAFAEAQDRVFPLGMLLGVGLVVVGVAGAAVAFLRRRGVSPGGGRRRAKPTP